ncbi:hypothetical protein B0H15DRAFT_787367 [Mycena belliarum]|uniref:CxC5 like cysteine cluster associated with KDZ domain-containing protein n=1 Tax=Mycena belliarum TaxID=1033014 RepID=A0AAD6XHV8_9AGAR|nr:hypothetical protein B0H15DRAFT_787367 [Mycena belliae]
MDFKGICDTLASSPDVSRAFSHTTIIKYIELIGLLKPTPILAFLQPSHRISAPPPTLPVEVHEFLKACFDLPDETGKLAWEAFRVLAWSFDPTPEEQSANRIKHVRLFLRHGVSKGLGVYSLYPPTRVCLDPNCARPLHSTDGTVRDRELGESKSHPITVFSLELGAVPGYSTSRYCRNCHTRYYPDFYVHDHATIRTFYLTNTMPEFIHTSEHFYTTADLCELFANMMVSAWTSGTNCARIYNTSISKSALESDLPIDWQTTFQMDVDDVWNAFYTYSLRLDYHERQEVMELQHNAPSQADRLRSLLEVRNSNMAGTGQEEWNHACDLCCYIYLDPDADKNDPLFIRSTVTDGITMGHPCCGVLDCQERLRSVKDKFCLTHQKLNKQCCITTCRDEVEPGFRTCTNPDHRDIELYHYQLGKAMFQLKNRLQLSYNGSTLPDSLPESQPAPPSSRLPPSEDEEIELVLPAAEICDGKPAKGNRTVRARFSRKRTHNEQLSVYSCGITPGRATFFGSEAPNGVREFWMKLWPTKASLPAVLWHDNNCSIVKMLRNDPDEYMRHYFDNVALPVDVFHFKSKHKETDLDCGANCNPYIWPELRTADGKWRFNSSAAEQTNAWFGGFQSMVREMTVERYNFFLDEMIKRRNRALVKELHKRGKAPHNIPRELLLAEFSSDTGGKVQYTGPVNRWQIVGIF